MPKNKAQKINSSKLKNSINNHLSTKKQLKSHSDTTLTATTSTADSNKIKSREFDTKLNELKQRHFQNKQVPTLPCIDNQLTINRNSSATARIILKPSTLETLKAANKLNAVQTMVDSLLADESSKQSSSSSSTVNQPTLSSVDLLHQESKKVKYNTYASLEDSDDEDGEAIAPLTKKSKYSLKASILGSYGQLDDEI